MRRRTLTALIMVSLAMLVACGGNKPSPTPTLTITNNSLMDAVIGTPFTAQLQTSGAVGAVTWSVSSGALTPGLSLNATTGTISGTPTTPGTCSFTVQANTATQQAQQSLTHRTVLLSLTPSSLPDGKVGVSYNTTLQLNGASGTVSWGITGLPAGLTSTAVNPAPPYALAISGTSTTAGQFAVTLNVMVASATMNASIVAHYTMNIQPGSALAITSASTLPNARWGTLYNQSLQATGGTPPYAWTLQGDPNAVLPAGLTFNNGTLTGMPATVGGPTSFQVTLKDSAASPASVAGTFSLTVSAPPFAITTSALPDARVNATYRITLATTPNGGQSVLWSSSNLPTGMNLNAASGQLAWAPSATGAFPVSVHAAQPDGQTSDRTFTLNVVGINAAARNDGPLNATPLTNGRFRASISPYADLNGNASPDTDYYQLTALGGATVTIETFAARLTDVNSDLDTVIEIVDANGHRFSTCRDIADDTAFPGLQLVVDQTPLAYDDSCVNDDYAPGSLDSLLYFRVPGTPGQPTTFYVHVLDWRGDARPDFIYDISISGVD